MEEKRSFSKATFTPSALLVKGPWLYLFTTLFTLILFFVFRGAFLKEQSVHIEVPVLILIAILFVGAFLWGRKHPLTTESYCMLLFATALLLHLTYTFYTGVYTRQHDVYGYTDSGHMGYIYYIYENNALPDSLGYQNYHPPLSHIMGAVLLRLNDATSGSLNMGLESLRLLPFMYITWVTVVAYRLLKRLNLSDTARLLAFAFICLHPTMTILSSSINNDALAFFFSMATFYRLIVWYQEPNTKNIVVMALLLACAALSKISSLQLAVPIGLLFLVMLIAKNESAIRGALSTKKLWIQYIIFAVISIPLALSFSIRNRIRFDQPLGYVPTIGDETLDQYVGNYSFVDRFVKPFSPNLFNNVFCTIPGDYNVYDYLLRCSIFGEFFYLNADFICRVLTVLNAIIIFFVIGAMVVAVVSKVRWTKEGMLWLTFLLYAAALWISYISFNLSFPFACTMDFRYLLPMIFLSAIFLAGLYDWLASKEGSAAKIFKGALCITIFLFLMGTSIFYLSIN